MSAHFYLEIIDEIEINAASIFLNAYAQISILLQVLMRIYFSESHICPPPHCRLALFIRKHSQIKSEVELLTRT